MFKSVASKYCSVQRCARPFLLIVVVEPEWLMFAFLKVPHLRAALVTGE